MLHACALFKATKTYLRQTDTMVTLRNMQFTLDSQMQPSDSNVIVLYVLVQ